MLPTSVWSAKFAAATRLPDRRLTSRLASLLTDLADKPLDAGDPDLAVVVSPSPFMATTAMTAIASAATTAPPTASARRGTARGALFGELWRPTG